MKLGAMKEFVEVSPRAHTEFDIHSRDAVSCIYPDVVSKGGVYSSAVCFLKTNILPLYKEATGQNLSTKMRNA